MRCYGLAMSRRLPSLLTTAALAAGLTAGLGGCPNEAGKKPKAKPTGEALATVGGDPLTVEALQKKLDEQSPFVRARYAEPGKKKEFVDGQVRFEVLAKEARARGYEDDPEVEDAIKKIIVQRLTREEFDGRVQLKDITDAELRSYYDAHKADYQKPEMVRASVITFAIAEGKMTKDQAKAKAQEVAKKAKEKLDDRAHFKALVEEHSADPVTKAAGGDIRYLDRAEVEGRYGKPAADWLFAPATDTAKTAAEDVGAVSDPFEVTQGGTSSAFVVMKRTGRRKAIERDFEAVKNQIKNVVYREKRTTEFNAFVEQLKQKHKVVIHEDKLEKLKIDPSAAAAGVDMGGHAGHGHGAPGPMPTMPGAGGDDDGHQD